MCAVVTKNKPTTSMSDYLDRKISKVPHCLQKNTHIGYLLCKKLKPQSSVIYFLWAYAHGCREEPRKDLDTGESVDHSGNWGPRELLHRLGRHAVKIWESHERLRQDLGSVGSLDESK